ncbi:MAG: hypothetical protein LBC74_01865 [Planctomycetaceae bacterium]|jgi:hypothetical protein|nr:hypothetical protein [Planctomycetaceae bacterium]
MLLFYIWDGIKSENISNLKLEYVDGIKWDEFIRLRFFWEECKENGILVDYTEDSFFDRDQVEILYHLCRKKHENANVDFYINGIGKRPSMTLYVHLLEILSKVFDSKKALFLMCD